MDIDDILAEVDDRAIPQETRDLQELTRAWVTERSAPEILPWPEALMERVLGRVSKQVRQQATSTPRYQMIDLDYRLSWWKNKPATQTPKPTSDS